MFHSRSAVRSQHPTLILLIAALSGAGCAAGERRELAASDVHDALQARESSAFSPPSEEQLAGLDALRLPRPTREECADPRTAGYWRACALAWNPAVRAARRELERSLAAAGAAGRPGSIDPMAETMDLGDVELESKVAVTFDLLGIVGLGSSRAAREASRADVRQARGGLEAAVWSAMFGVERSRVRLAAARLRVKGLIRILKDVEACAVRFEILERRGRLSEAEAGMVKAAEHEIEHAISSAVGREAELRAELARASGMPFEHQVLGRVGGEALDELRRVPRLPDGRELLEQDPALRERVLEYARAEANVRLVAARAWPALRAGPQLTFDPSDVLVGGLLQLSLPWPGTVERELRVASSEREAARERVEDALNAALARVASLDVVEREARMLATDHALAIDDAQEAAWRATNARLRLGMVDAMEWTRAVRERIGPLVGLVDARESAALAALDLAEACGRVPHAQEVTP